MGRAIALRKKRKGTTSSLYPNRLGGCYKKEVANFPANLATNSEEFIKRIRDDCALLIEKEIGVYEFAHLSFQEYLAAVEIKAEKKEYVLIKNINKSWWSETIRLYAAINDATNLIRAIINMPVPSINAFLVVADYEEEGWLIDNHVRQQISDKLDAGLQSDDAQIFKLAAEVKLARRSSNFAQIDENLSLDNSDITCAEYQLFINDNGCRPQTQKKKSFDKGQAKNIVDGITIDDANQFCLWLSLKNINNQLDKLDTWYRFPTPKERKQYKIPEENKTKIRLLRCKLPSIYSQLAKYLMRREWKKADEETLKVMQQVAGENQGYLDINAIDNFPCEDLRIIDTLWVSTSNGHFGFSVQKEIYQSLGATREYNEKVWKDFCDRVGWRAEVVDGQKVSNDTRGNHPYLSGYGYDTQFPTIYGYDDTQRFTQRYIYRLDYLKEGQSFFSLVHKLVKCNI